MTTHTADQIIRPREGAPTMTTPTEQITVPADRVDYARWLAGKVSGLAAQVRGDASLHLSALERELLRDAARAMLDALDRTA